MAYYVKSRPEEPEGEKKSVVIGPYQSKDEANQVKDKLNDNPKMQELNVRSKVVDRNPFTGVSSHRVETSTGHRNQGRPRKKSLASRLIKGY